MQAILFASLFYFNCELELLPIPDSMTYYFVVVIDENETAYISKQYSIASSSFHVEETKTKFELLFVNSFKAKIRSSHLFDHATKSSCDEDWKKQKEDYRAKHMATWGW